MTSSVALGAVLRGPEANPDRLVSMLLNTGGVTSIRYGEVGAPQND